MLPGGRSFKGEPELRFVSNRRPALAARSTPAGQASGFDSLSKLFMYFRPSKSISLMSFEFIRPWLKTFFVARCPILRQTKAIKAASE
jgi:hypothetical protein